MTPEKMVLEFHQKYGHLISSEATVEIPLAVSSLRMRLIREEIGELLRAITSDDLEGIADGIADSVYVLIGTAISYGIPFDRVFQEVHRSNMTKTHVKALNGEKYGTKTPKGPNYIPPQIGDILTDPDSKTQLEEINDSATVS